MNRSAQNQKRPLWKVGASTLILCLASGATACSGSTVQTQPTSVHRSMAGLPATDGLWVRHDQRTTAGQLEVANTARARGDLWVPAPHTPAPASEDAREAPRLDAFLGKVTGNRL